MLTYLTARQSAAGIATALGLAIASTQHPGYANPRPLPFTYSYETLARGESEVEQYVDATPLRALSEDGETKLWEPRWRLQTEYEHGISDRLELGLYVVLQSDPGQPLFVDGTKQRLRLRLAEQGDWPLDVALYGEVSEFHDELEFEEKLILSRRLGSARIVTNLVLEQAFEYYSGAPELSFNPTAGITYELNPSIHLGLEYWMQSTLGSQDPADFNAATHHYLGPALMWNFGRFWYAAAAYYRLSQTSRRTELDDAFGHLWFRSVIGIDVGG